MSEIQKRILDLSANDARNFLLKSESYCSLDLPPYFSFGGLISNVNKVLLGKKLSDLVEKPYNFENVNYTILNNKDGKYAWRPFQLINPVLYVALVHEITTEDNWKLICNRFSQFSANEKIRCKSIPIVSQAEESDKAEQVSYWWNEVEQKSIEIALDFDYLIQTDITDCYGSIYTHSIAWALHTKVVAKSKRNDSSLIGNQIDKHIQNMQYSQTNGIPQGSALMDFIAEMVLGYMDLELSEKIDDFGIDDYLILRYRDDYRIFCNNPCDGECIVKLLTEVAISMGLKLNPAKTKASDDVVKASIKSDKLEWICRKSSENNLQKHLLIIHDHAVKFPNAGSVAKALQEYYKRISSIRRFRDNPLPLISITVDIAYRNPRTYPVSAALLSKLFSFLDDENKRCTIVKIKHKFSKIPNTGHLEIWLQRIAFTSLPDIKFDELLCKIVSGEKASLWNIDWITDPKLKKAVNNSKIIDNRILGEIESIIPVQEIELFVQRQIDS